MTNADTAFAMVAGQGTFFDEHIDLRDPEGTDLTARVMAIYGETWPRLRGWKASDLANHEVRIRKVLANAMRVSFYRTLPSLLYFRGADPPSYRDKPQWMKHGSLGDVVDVLVAAGLLESITGKKMPWYSQKQSTTSSYAPTAKLTRLAADCGVGAKSVEHRRAAGELVQLYGPKPKREFSWIKGGLVQPGRGQPIRFEPTAETRGWVDTLEAINDFYRQQSLDLGLSQEELARWLKARNEDPDRTGTPYRMPELFKTDIYRVFNDGNEADPTFDRGGRLFGGWWMSVAEELRKAITINGQPTVEIDYKECHPRMLYHRAGLGGEGDLYSLPEIAAYEAATGVATGTYRPYVKWLTNVLINSRGRPQAVIKPDDITLPPDFTTEQMIGFIESRHQPIAGDFKTGAGLDLMRLESDIALEIVSSAMVEGWTVLSVHDSFLTTTDRQQRLRELMIGAYAKRLGRKPSLK